VKSITSHDTPDSELNAYFGAKIDKNGLHYSGRRTKEETQAIEVLYQKVIGEDKVFNNQLTGSLARAVVVEFRDRRPVKWVSFAATL
jgi:hypothetical protein